jgi:hypothetical protein
VLQKTQALLDPKKGTSLFYDFPREVHVLYWRPVPWVGVRGNVRGYSWAWSGRQAFRQQTLQRILRACGRNRKGDWRTELSCRVGGASVHSILWATGSHCQVLISKTWAPALEIFVLKAACSGATSWTVRQVVPQAALQATWALALRGVTKGMLRALFWVVCVLVLASELHSQTLCPISLLK